MTADEDLREALDLLDARGPGRMVPDMDRITRLMALLGDPQAAAPSVHVTGTNGKGSVVRMVAALADATGLVVGSYTSPHLTDVRERIAVSGRPIARDDLARLVHHVVPFADLVDRASIERDGADADRVTYFELLTAMAFTWFADVPVDLAVIEVGMGGRWDATNVLDADVAVIGEVDVDHRELGSTPVEVAREKVGIIGPGAVVVSAVQTPEVTAVVEAAACDVGAELVVVGRDVEVVHRRPLDVGQVLRVRVGRRVIDDVIVPLHGAHQARNAALALAAFAAAMGVSFDTLSDDIVRAGFARVVVPGRLELLARDPAVVVDGAHNPHGARAAAAGVAEAFGFRDVILVVACLDDKDVEGILGAFRDTASHVIVTTAPSPRSASLARMVAAAQGVWSGTGVHVEVADDVVSAIALARAIAGPRDGVLVAGSLTAVGAARDHLRPFEGMDGLEGEEFLTLVTDIDRSGLDEDEEPLEVEDQHDA